MNQLLQGDCLEVMRGLPDNSVDAVVTDPPYGLQFMGKRWDYDVPTVEVWREVLRLLKPGGHLLSFAGTRTQHRMTVNIEDAGFDIKDMLAWCYGSGFPKSHNLSGEWQGWGSALKPALEPITLARKPLQGTIAQNVQEWGTGAINVDECRVGYQSQGDIDRARGRKGDYKKMGQESGNSFTVEFATPLFKSEVDPAGRWPANLIHDGSPEVLGVFPRSVARPVKPDKIGKSGSGEKRSMFGNSSVVQSGYYDTDSSAARFFYCAKASKADRDEGLEGKRNNHCTVKPTDLMRYLCRLITPPGGVILDPFMGSGSTGKAAMLEGFQFIGIEMEAEYLEIARARIAAAVQRSETMSLEQRVAWLETQVQAQGAKLRRIEAQQQLSLWGNAQ